MKAAFGGGKCSNLLSHFVGCFILSLFLSLYLPVISGVKGGVVNWSVKGRNVSYITPLSFMRKKTAKHSAHEDVFQFLSLSDVARAVIGRGKWLFGV